MGYYLSQLIQSDRFPLGYSHPSFLGPPRKVPPCSANLREPGNRSLSSCQPSSEDWDWKPTVFWSYNNVSSCCTASLCSRFHLVITTHFTHYIIRWAEATDEVIGGWLKPKDRICITYYYLELLLFSYFFLHLLILLLSFMRIYMLFSSLWWLGWIPFLSSASLSRGS